MTESARWEERVRSRVMMHADEVRRRLAADRSAVVISTSSPLSQRAKDDIVAGWRKRVGLDQVSVQFLVLEDQDDDVLVATPDRGAAPERDPRSLPRGWHGDTHIVTVRSGYRRTHHLVQPGSDWLPVGRFASPDQPDGSILLPDDLDTLPRGGLLEYRFGQDELTLRRTDARSEGEDPVRIEVGGTALGVGGTAAVRAGNPASLRYTQHPAQWSLVIELDHWRAVSVLDGYRPEPVRGQSLDVLGAGGVAVTVEPPSSEYEIGLRGFPVFEPNRSGPPQSLLARVLVCSGADAVGNEYHVKIYRCGTDTEARILHGFIAEQVGRLRRAQQGLPRPAVLDVHVVGPLHTPALAVTGLITDKVVAPERPAEAALLASWFGIPPGPGSACYVMVIAPWLRGCTFPPRRDNPEPAVDQLARLLALAEALDSCHERDVVHGDIKLDHLRLLGSGDEYVLVDVDSVAAGGARADSVRTTWDYAAPTLITLARGDFDFDGKPACTSDRFAFALLVIGAVAGTDRLSEITAGRPEAIVDDPIAARQAILAFWEPRWSRFAEVLATGLDSYTLLHDKLRLADWVRALQATGPFEPEVTRAPDPGLAYGPVQGPALARVHRAVREAHDAEFDDVLVESLRQERLSVALSSYWVHLGYRGVVVIVLALAIVVVGGRFV